MVKSLEVKPADLKPRNKLIGQKPTIIKYMDIITAS